MDPQPSKTPANPLLPDGRINQTVADSIAKPTAFSKPGTMQQGKQTPKGTRFRPLTAKRTPGRQRKRKRDPRSVEFY